MTTIGRPQVMPGFEVGDTGPDPILLADRPKPRLTPRVPGAALTSINPADDLRSRQITPGADPRLRTAERQSDLASKALSGFSGFTPFQGVPTAGSPYVDRAQSYGEQATTALGSGQVAGTNVGGARGYLDRAAQAGGVTGGGAVQAGGYSPGGDTTNVRGLMTTVLSQMAGGPDRQTL